MKRLFPAIVLVCALVSGALAQDESGAIDTRGSTQEQIKRIERLTQGDVPPDKLTVYLRWLADLYTSAGELDKAQQAYDRILVLDPYDLGTVNLLATFLLDQRHKAGDAQQLLERNIAWAAKAEPRPLSLGQSYSLYARALDQLNRHQEAIDASEHALANLDPDAAEAALRTQAASWKALGKRDQAIAAYERLVGLTGGANADDVNALIAYETRAHGSIDAGKFHARMRALIEDARRKRAEDLRHEGAEMVELEGEGHVRLEGTLRRGKGPDAVLLVPDLGGHRSVFTPYAQLLSIDGFTTLTIDPRGQGDSRCDSLPSFQELSTDQREHIPSDIATAHRYLRETLKIPADRIAVMVEGEACGDVEQAMHEHGLDAIVVDLSPVFDPLDRDLATAMEFRAPRPTLMVVSGEDMFSVRSVDSVRGQRPSNLLTVHAVAAAGHGAALLRQPEIYAWVSSWLGETFPPAH
ncbi:MAG TPA: hypothetical protein VFH88_11990 [Candidatus Krumholzibacteria bacterium]|nr:hypothetical protein [Candidatus Krumholzibacteria bacterium]